MKPRPFIQKLIGIIAGVLSSIFFLALEILPRLFSEREESLQLRIGIGVAVLLWFGMLSLMYIFVRRVGAMSRDRVIQVWVTVVSFTALRLVIEVPFLALFLMVILGFFVALLFGWADNEGQVMHVQKIIRRLVAGLWVFNAYALVTVLFALSSFFQQQVPFFLLSLLGAVVLGGVSWMIWLLYFPEKEQQDRLLSAGVLSLAMFQLFWIMKYLPLGYLVLGIMITWVWYVLQLFFRFNFSSQGILWKDQRVFLLMNVVLYMFMLVFLVRWI